MTDPLNPFPNLRERAEASAAPWPSELPELTDDAARRLVHELQVHQIELEIQNEELRRLMADLEQSRNQFFRLFHRAPIGYVVLDEVGLIHKVNETFCQMVRQSRHPLIGRPFADVLNSSEDRGVFLGRYRALFRRPAGKILEARIQCVQGPAFYAQLEGAILETPLDGPRERGAPLLMLAVTDITARKAAEEQRWQLEQQMQQTQKLESLGVLAGGIAHDFNNLLTIILGNASLALDELPSISPSRDSLRAIEKTALRAAELCRQMLAYSGQGRFVIETIHLDELICEMASLFKSSLPKKATLNLNLADALPPLRGDPSQIRQVVMNLVINASEALDDRSGVVTVSTGAMQCRPDDLAGAYREERLAEGVYVWLEVSDTGCGMNSETQRRVFEPFFTTKFTGRGLGLSAVLGIVRGHQGALQVVSTPGQGTTFKVLFPAAPPVGPQSASPPRAPLGAWQGMGIVLLVDDEDSVRTLGARMLERIGFQVLVASDGQEALELYQVRQGEIVLVLLDLTMPYMDGEETFQQLRCFDPQVRVVMTSGYTETEMALRFTGQPRCGFLQKPYTLEGLTQCLREALGKGG
ncbi:MAG TPA: ATP-binding protein [Candidatus Competibacteraceae bacterium]|nr:ATP-binding protein [Candidatus Competibacteraceae bacterium]